MTISRIINLFAGLMLLIGLVLAHMSGAVDLTEASWLWLTAFVALNLVQFALTGFCPLETILRKAGFKDSTEQSGCGSGGCGSH